MSVFNTDKETTKETYGLYVSFLFEFHDIISRALNYPVRIIEPYSLVLYLIIIPGNTTSTPNSELLVSIQSALVSVREI